MSLREVITTVEVVDSIAGSRESRLRAQTKVNHMQTNTTQNTMELADAAEKALNDIVAEIARLYIMSRLELADIRTRFESQVRTVIASAIRESYFLGFHFVEAYAEEAIDLTPRQTVTITNQVNNQVEAFWTTIETTIEDIDDEVAAADDEDLESTPATTGRNFREPILRATLITKAGRTYNRSATTSMTFRSLNEGTVETLQQLADEAVLEFTGEVRVPLVIWVSERDNRVCPICLNLDGRTWAVNDVALPRPVTDSHYGCRCRLLPLDKGRAYNA